jgi:hypothetical protein
MEIMQDRTLSFELIFDELGIQRRKLTINNEQLSINAKQKIIKEID